MSPLTKEEQVEAGLEAAHKEIRDLRRALYQTLTAAVVFPLVVLWLANLADSRFDKGIESLQGEMIDLAKVVGRHEDLFKAQMRVNETIAQRLNRGR